MLDLKFIRENPDAVRNNTAHKNESANVDAAVELDQRRRTIIQEVEALKNKRNVVSAEIAVMKRAKQDATSAIEEMRIVSDTIKQFDDELRGIEEELENHILRIPNMLHESVPIGKSAEDNIEVRRTGECIETGFRKNHVEIGKSLGILDFERGAKVSGSGFGFYVGKGATLERALINFMLDFHLEKHGYSEIFPPFLVNSVSMRGTGQLPKMAEDMYHCQLDDLYAIPTAEVPITNFHRDDTLSLEDLPKKFCGYSACFRREAGSYGKDTRGFLRVHQFNKVELVKFAHPSNSYDELELLVVDVEDILNALNIPYRVLLLCSGDTSFSSAKTYDLEAWSPAEQKWLEVSSCSNFENYQARRANIKFREASGKPDFVHTLNGSGLATSRLMVAILEHYQLEDGHIQVPEVLLPYCRFTQI
ncbi:MAG: serine--tRNA ligase [Bacteroidetes bacterium]|nr:serine--tRNA ligase [Bacteroidota bacterium]